MIFNETNMKNDNVKPFLITKFVPLGKIYSMKSTTGNNNNQLTLLYPITLKMDTYFAVPSVFTLYDIINDPNISNNINIHNV